MKKGALFDGRRLLNLLGKDKAKYILGVGLCALIVPAFDLAFPWVTKLMINAVEQSDQRLLLKGFGLIGIMVALYAILVPIGAYIYEGSCRRPLLRIRLDLLKHMMRVPFRYFQKQHSGELMTRMTGDIRELLIFYKDRTYEILATLVQGVGSLIMLFVLDTRLALLLIGLGAITAYSRKYKIENLKANGQETRQLLGDANSIVTDSLSGMKVLRAFKNESIVMNRFTATNEGIVQKEKEKTALDIRRDALSYIMETMNFVGVLCVGAYMISTDQLDVGTVFATVMLQSIIITMFSKLGTYIFGIRVLLARSARVFELIDVPEEDISAIGENQDEVVKDELIRIQGVNFSYQEGQQALTNVNTAVMPNEMVALVGESGTGKSTLSKILCGLIPFDSGSIYLLGQPASMVMLRKKVAYVAQEPYLFSGTIFENIKIAKPNATIEEVEWAARKACAHEFIVEQTDGYETLVGERGCTLSGGQVQRIAIARALLKDAPVILLDEATSAIDSETESQILENLLDERKNRTIIFVAHRPTISKRADRVIEMKHGNIA